MAKSLTIELSDADYEALRIAAEAAHMSPEQLASQTVAKRLAGNSNELQIPEPSQDPVLQIMRKRGHLVDPRAFPLPQVPDMPPYGTPEWDQMVEEIGEELSDAAEAMGIDLANLSDLVER